MKKIILSMGLFAFVSSMAFCADVMEESHPVLILGGGVGGLTSATYLCRAGITPIVITGPLVGGAITQSHNVENWPGQLSIPGITLSEEIRAQAEKNGADLRFETVIAADFSKIPYQITTKALMGDQESLKRYKVDACIIAMGATPNLLNIPGETNYWSNGVYTCAVCDGGLYKEKTIAVVGGGDAALIEAQYLANIAAKVHLILRKKDFRTVEKQRMEQILSYPNIEVHYETVVREIQGDGAKVTHVLLQSSGKKQERLAVDGVFLAIGSQPNTQLFKGQLDLDPAGYIVLKKHQETSCKGVYAVGDVADPEFKQAVSAAGDGAKAALQAQLYLAAHPRAPVLLTKSVEENKGFKKEVTEVSSLVQLEEVLNRGQGPVFIDFYADYCGPCRMFAPLYANWAKKYGDRVTFLKVDATMRQELCAKFEIRVLPTLIIFDEKGKVVQRVHGFNEMGAIEKRLDRYQQTPGTVPRDF